MEGKECNTASVEPQRLPCGTTVLRKLWKTGMKQIWHKVNEPKIWSNHWREGMHFSPESSVCLIFHRYKLMESYYTQWNHDILHSHAAFQFQSCFYLLVVLLFKAVLEKQTNCAPEEVAWWKNTFQLYLSSWYLEFVQENYIFLMREFYLVL